MGIQVHDLVTSCPDIKLSELAEANGWDWHTFCSFILRGHSPVCHTDVVAPVDFLIERGSGTGAADVSLVAVRDWTHRQLICRMRELRMSGWLPRGWRARMRSVDVVSLRPGCGGLTIRDCLDAVDREVQDATTVLFQRVCLVVHMMPTDVFVACSHQIAHTVQSYGVSTPEQIHRIIEADKLLAGQGGRTNGVRVRCVGC